MSVAVLTAVFSRSQAVHANRLVLIAIADNAADDGVAWPRQEEIAKKAKLGGSTVQKAIHSLVKLGELEARTAQRGKRRINVYRILLGSPDAVDYDRLPFELEEPFTTPQIEGSSASTTPQIEGSNENPRPLDSGPTTPQVEGSLNTITINRTITGTADAVPDVVHKVYDHWRFRRGKTRANYDVMSPGRREKIVARLREFSADDLCRAIDGVEADPWVDRPLHDDITNIFRSHETVDRFLEFADNPPAPSGKDGGLTAEQIYLRGRQP